MSFSSTVNKSAKAGTFERALACLVSPISLAAMAVLALNDQVFKRIWPAAWLSGKLSDLSGLFLLALLGTALAGLLPFLRNRPALAGVLACLGVGLGFALIKTDALAGAWVVTHLGVRLVRDPTDLIALVVLPLAAWMMASTGAPSSSHKTWGYAALAMASLLLLADAAAPDLGILCLSVENGKTLAAVAGYGVSYTSHDGGLTWQNTAAAQTLPASNCENTLSNQVTIIASPDGSIRFRITPDQSVESQAGTNGVWKKEYNLKPLNVREQAYIQKTRSGNIYFANLPLNTVFDPNSGNLVLAMGQDGVLVRKPDGSWLAVAVGPYTPLSLEAAGFGGMLVLLQGEIVLAGIIASIVFSALSIRIRRRRFDWLRLLVGLILWGTVAGIFKPVLMNGPYAQLFVISGLLASGLWALSWAIANAIRLGRRSLTLAGLGLAAGVVYLAPYFLWGYGLIPEYDTAALAGVILAAVITLLAAVKKKDREQPAKIVE
jgi:hypothetical protein